MSDESARNRAIDPNQSFIVQAPAGSGKTELLTQRYLNLLANTVNNPEEIIAITFTRKAASEMRERIIHSLELADNEPLPEEPHKQKTWHLASKVLETNKELNWHLLQNPNRLRIITIDALSAWLNAQIPLLSGFGAKAKILEDSGPLYAQATKNIIENPGPLKNEMNLLLLHLDNNAELLSQLLMTLLQKREQWLPHIIQFYQYQEQLKPLMEQGLEHIITDTLAKAEQLIPDQDKPHLINLCSGAATLLANTDPNHPLCATLNTHEFPQPNFELITQWQAVAHLLLTKDKKFRSKVDKRLGFPPDKKTEKTQLLELIESYRENNELRIALVNILECPPAQYTQSQWNVLGALLTALPVLCAELHLGFRAHEGTDFVELTLGALRALGNEDSPTDLALYLDYQIKHLLIDEFQDTSVMQFTLIEKLIQAWQSDDGRSLFLVGDPMQSIYRFRNAEVGLFIRTQAQGINQFKLTPLTLNRNFRSRPSLVDWVNQTFTDIFPKQSDIYSGAVSYTASASALPSHQDENICYYASTAHDPSPLITLVREINSNNPNDTVAILVKSRTHLSDIIPALTQAKLPFQAVELETLASRPEIIDLLSLTKALTHLSNRTAWLALLRSPWCGLMLVDLYALCQAAGEKPLWNTLAHYTQIDSLSLDAKKRLSFITPILAHAFKQQGILSLAQWVKGIWLAFNGPDLLQDEAAKLSAARYFELLNDLQYDFSIEKLEEKLLTLYAKPDNQLEAKLHIMTIHKSKGLEFDHVIIPELQRTPPPNKDELLMWLQSPNQYGGEDLIFAPIKASFEKQDKIHCYLKNLEKNKLQHEATRVLYVALTRAKKSLHLHCSLNVDEAGEPIPPSKNSFAYLLWEKHRHKFIQTFTPNEPQANEGESPEFKLNRQTNATISSHTKLLMPVNEATNELNHAQPINIAVEQSARIGSVIHEALQLIADDGIEAWKNNPIHWQKRLRQLGAHTTSPQLIQQAIEKTLADPKGQWILSKHCEAASEFALCALIKDKVQRLVVDRTFVDKNNTRWIIDFKSATPDNESLADFLQKQKTLYQGQLSRYAHAFNLMETRPIKLGLYFPLISAWVEWEAKQVREHEKTVPAAEEF